MCLLLATGAKIESVRIASRTENLLQKGNAQVRPAKVEAWSCMTLMAPFKESQIVTIPCHEVLLELKCQHDTIMV